MTITKVIFQSAQRAYLLTVMFSLAILSTAVDAKTFDDNTSDRYTIESAYYRITQMPTATRQGRIAVYDSLEDQLSNCKACAKSLYLSPNTQIRIGYEGSMYSVGDVVDLPPQSVYLVVDDGIVVKIGFPEIDMGDLGDES